MEIKTTQIEGITLVTIDGKLDSTTASEAENEINTLLENQVEKMVVSLKNTTYVSSAGLRVFLATAKKMTAAGGVVKFCSPNDIVEEILNISGFTTILDIRATEEEAIGSF
jgi:anti-anti-sigma factor